MTINAAAAMPPTVPPTMVAVDGFVLALTGSAIGCPVGWLPSGMPLSLRFPGSVLTKVGIDPVESDVVVDVTSVSVLNGVPLSMGLPTATVGAEICDETKAEIGVEVGMEAGVESDIAPAAGIGVGAAGAEGCGFATPASFDDDDADIAGFAG